MSARCEPFRRGNRPRLGWESATCGADGPWQTKRPLLRADPIHGVRTGPCLHRGPPRNRPSPVAFRFGPCSTFAMGGEAGETPYPCPVIVGSGPSSGGHASPPERQHRRGSILGPGRAKRGARRCGRRGGRRSRGSLSTPGMPCGANRVGQEDIALEPDARDILKAAHIIRNAHPGGQTIDGAQE